MTSVGGPRQLNIIGELDKRTGQVRISREARQFIYDVWRRTGGDTDTVETALNSSAYAIASPPGYVWRSDPSGVYPSGDPTQDSTMTFYDADGNDLGAAVLRATLTTSSGNISVTTVSLDDGVSYSLDGDGTDSVRADITIVLSSGKQLTSSLSWNSIDVSTAGATPSVGGGK